MPTEISYRPTLEPGLDDDQEGKNKLDIYRPAAGDSSGSGLPVLVFIHGGGLLMGDKHQYAPLGERIASNGTVCVVLNHRLSPGACHPAHIEDIAAGYAWVVRNISQHGGDPERICLFGHSSGGYLAALLALDGRYLGAHGLDPTCIRGVVPISGFFHVERLAPERPKTVWGEAPNVWESASPARYVSETAPPTLLLYASGDAPERRQESVELATLLRAKGHTRVATAEIGDRDHASIIVRFGSEGDETAKRLLEFVGDLVG